MIHGNCASDRGEIMEFQFPLSVGTVYSENESGNPFYNKSDLCQ